MNQYLHEKCAQKQLNAEIHAVKSIAAPGMSTENEHSC